MRPLGNLIDTFVFFLFLAELLAPQPPTRPRARSVERAPLLRCAPRFCPRTHFISIIPLQILLRHRLSVVQRQQVRPSPSAPGRSRLHSRVPRRKPLNLAFAAAEWWRLSPAAAKSALCAGEWPRLPPPVSRPSQSDSVVCAQQRARGRVRRLAAGRRQQFQDIFCSAAARRRWFLLS